MADLEKVTREGTKAPTKVQLLRRAPDPATPAPSDRATAIRNLQRIAGNSGLIQLLAARGWLAQPPDAAHGPVQRLTDTTADLDASTGGSNTRSVRGNPGPGKLLAQRQVGDTDGEASRKRRAEAREALAVRRAELARRRNALEERKAAKLAGQPQAAGGTGPVAAGGLAPAKGAPAAPPIPAASSPEVAAKLAKWAEFQVKRQAELMSPQKPISAEETPEHLRYWDKWTAPVDRTVATLDPAKEELIERIWIRFYAFRVALTNFLAVDYWVPQGAHWRRSTTDEQAEVKRQAALRERDQFRVLLSEYAKTYRNQPIPHNKGIEFTVAELEQKVLFGQERFTEENLWTKEYRNYRKEMERWWRDQHQNV